MLRKGIILLHDNIRPHVTCIVQYALHSMCYMVLSLTLYNLDLPLCEFCVPGPLKKVLKALDLGQTEDIQAMVVQWFQQQPGSSLLRQSISWFVSGMLP
jgi:hypothetical protein